MTDRKTGRFRLAPDRQSGRWQTGRQPGRERDRKTDRENADLDCCMMRRI